MLVVQHDGINLRPTAAWDRTAISVNCSEEIPSCGLTSKSDYTEN